MGIRERADVPTAHEGHPQAWGDALCLSGIKSGLGAGLHKCILENKRKSGTFQQSEKTFGVAFIMLGSQGPKTDLGHAAVLWSPLCFFPGVDLEKSSGY